MSTTLGQFILLMLLLFLSSASLRAAEPSAAQATEVDKIAASMKPGEWKELKSAGYDSKSLMRGEDILAYAGKAAWDEKSQQVLFMGQVHLKGPPSFITYSVKNNAWKRMPTPPWAEELKWFHAYENNAADPIGGQFFHHSSATTKFYKYDAATDKWIDLPELKNAGTGHGTAIEYFPELGGLVRVLGGGHSDGTIHIWSAEKNAWSKLGDKLKMGPYHNFASYSPVKKAVIFGGGNGSTDIYLLDAAGKVTAGKPAPHPLGVNASLQVIDPASGDLLVLAKGGKLSAYSPVKDAWTELGSENIPSTLVKYSGSSLSAAPLGSHGVVLFFGSGPLGMKTYLYKHAGK